MLILSEAEIHTLSREAATGHRRRSTSRLAMRMTTAVFLVIAGPATVLAAPAAPSNLAASSASSTKINVTWSDNAANEAGLQLASATNAAFTGATVQSLPANTTSFGHLVTPATTRWYRARAVGGGSSAWSNVDAVTTPPGSLTAAAASSTSMLVSWVGNAANTHVTGYTVRYSTSPSFTNAQALTASGAGATSLTVTGLAPFQRYYFRVRANAGDLTSVEIETHGFPHLLSSPFIDPHFFGQNAWLPAVIGGQDQGGDFERLLPGLVFQSGVQLIRYGGNFVDTLHDATASPDEYVAMAQNIAAIGARPLLQVSQPAGAAAAAAIVHRVNVEEGLGVQYWEVGNEPERSYATTAADIAAYFQTFVPAMKLEDPNILIVGPDLAGYDPAIMTALTDTSNADNICLLIDVLTYHVYPFDGTQSRADVVARPEGNIAPNMVLAKTAAASCTAVRALAGRPPIRVAIGEMNVEYAFTDTTATGESAHSFLAGQFWAHVMKVAMRNGLLYVAPWSVKEGDPLGYINSADLPLSTYYHYQMLAKNFRGAYTATTHTVNSGAEPLVVTFAAKDPTQVAVMIMNQKKQASFSYTVRLDSGAVVANSALKVTVPASINVEYTAPQALPPQASALLLFDSAGNLISRTVYALPDAINEAGPATYFF